MALQGLAHFPGVGQVVSASISFAHGISPSVAMLEIVPQNRLTADVGTLSFTFGNQRVDFTNCKVDNHSLQWTARGQIWRLAIFDRRWKWRWGKIGGRYNLRAGDGKIQGVGAKDSTEKTPQEMARLCLEAMGERRYDVGNMPNDSRPEVDWDEMPPAEALASLCDQLGCRVVLGLDDRVHIYRVGQGATLPNNEVMEDSLTLDLPEAPDELAVLCGASRWQADFELEAVGLETDGTAVAENLRGAIRPIDELSYAPSAGWGNVDIRTMCAVTAGKKERELAKQTVYRWYRITMPPPGAADVTELKQVLPLFDVQCETRLIENRKVPKPALVYGTWCPSNYSLENVQLEFNPTGDTDSPWFRQWTLDRDLGIVKFSQPVFKNADHTSSAAPTSLRYAAADLRLRCAYNVRDAKTRAFDRYWRTLKTGLRNGTPTRYLRHEELIPTAIPTYRKDFSVSKWTFNDAEIDAACQYYLNAALSAYQRPTPNTKKYMGIKPVQLDGAVQQITFNVGPSGATTVVSRNDEQLDRIDPFDVRRQAERNRHAGGVYQALAAYYRRINQRMPTVDLS